MRSTALRFLAIALLLGQLVQLSGGVFCGSLRRHHAGHCEDGMTRAGGPSVSAASLGFAGGLCELIGPCSTPVPAVTAVPAAMRLVLSTLDLAVLPGDPAPLSFNPVPIPPPPQA